MALESAERAALHDDLADHLGRTTADRLMAALPDFDWSQLATRDYLDEQFAKIDQRFEHVDAQFKLVHDEFRLVHKDLALVHDRFKHVDDQFDAVNRQFKEVHSRLDRLDVRFDEAEAIIDGKVVTRTRAHFLAMIGIIVAHSALVLGAIGLVLAAST